VKKRQSARLLHGVGRGQCTRPGSAPVSGFVADQTVVLAIGNLEDKKFNVVWVGIAKVQ
jgi:hypothetical protein